MKPYLPILILLLVFTFGCASPTPVNETTAVPVTPSVPESPTPVESELETMNGITSQDVEYFGEIIGFLARPSDDAVYPGVVLIHEWWGLNENIKNEAQELAKEGYVVLAVDLYHGQVATTSQEAQALRNEVIQEEANQNMQAAVAYLRDTQGVPKVGSWGWCFGGGQSLQLAVSGVDLDATVVYYGSPITDETLVGKIDWPVLGIFGEEDQSIPVSKVNEFQTALGNTKKQYEVHIYPGVGHAFANPSNPNYSPVETEDAWGKTIAFLDMSLKG